MLSRAKMVMVAVVSQADSQNKLVGLVSDQWLFSSVQKS